MLAFSIDHGITNLRWFIPLRDHRLDKDEFSYSSETLAGWYYGEDDNEGVQFGFRVVDENVNLSCSTSNREILDPKKKKEIESWLGDSRFIDSLDGSNEIEYFDTFPIMEELEYREWLFKYPKPSWVKVKIRTRNLNNVKISCKMGHFLKRQTYIDLESPINVMSKQHYNQIMSKGLESRQKPSNPSKNNNFVGSVKGLKVFVGNFTYRCNFMILEDTTSIIDYQLGEVVFGKPFAKNTGLVYDQEEGTITFKKDDEKSTFKMPRKMEASNHKDFKNINTDSIPPFVLGSNDDHGNTYYSDSLTLGPEIVTRGHETTLLDVVKLGELGIVRFNGLGQAEIINDELDDCDEETKVAKENKAQEENEVVKWRSSVKLCQGCSSNMINFMGVNFMSSPQTYSTTPINPFGLFGNTRDVLSTSCHPGSDMDEE
nr:protein kinase-like domain, concanavalin A-like lectin/glucanase domain protein [Tanacetum cinerariifolium]